MSKKEIARQMIDHLPDDKLMLSPNAETIEAIEETDEMVRTGSGQHFCGSTEDFFR